MSTPFDIKTSIGTPTANSYVSVASADQYFCSRQNSDSWLNLSAGDTASTSTVREKKETLLIQATREIDNTYRFFVSKEGQGIKGEDTFQNLEFPRSGDVDFDNDLFIEDDVKFATFEQALWIQERTTQRKTEAGTLVERKIIGTESYNYMKGLVNRSVVTTGRYRWHGSNF